MTLTQAEIARIIRLAAGELEHANLRFSEERWEEAAATFEQLKWRCETLAEEASLVGEES